MDIGVYVYEERMSGPECNDMHPHLDLRCWHMAEGPFSHVAHHIYFYAEINIFLFSTVILSLMLIQEGQLSVSGERMCTILADRF